MTRAWRLTACLLTTLAFAQNEIRFVTVAQGVVHGTDIQNAGDGSGRLFFAQQDGVIHVYKNGQLLPTPFLDISGKTFVSGECGLVGLAFPPNFAAKQYFYVLYTDIACTNRILSRYSIGSDPDTADFRSEQVVLTIPQPERVHIGGQLRFGRDGFLYVSSGDGFTGADPQNNAQNGLSLLGKIWRIDTETDRNQYFVPAANPFAGRAGYLPELWALGLRNPWRFSFDRQTGAMWIGDVGESTAEEVDYSPPGSSGLNFGWRILEGRLCYGSDSPVCATPDLTLPIREYLHSAGDKCVVGGFVYRGTRFPALFGTYIHADYISRRFRGISASNPTSEPRLLATAEFAPTAFGEDEQGELYVTGYDSATVYRIEGATSGVAPTIIAPTANQSVGVSGVDFQWTAVANATGYDLRVLEGTATVFQGTLLGGNSLSTLVSLGDGVYTFQVRACLGAFTDAACTAFGSVNFSVVQSRPAARPAITAPSLNQEFTTSTQTFSWTSVAGVSAYEILLSDVAAGGVPELSMSLAGTPPPTSTVFSMRGSTNYRLQVRACSVACGEWSDPIAFRVTLSAAPSQAPSAPTCSLNGLADSCSWSPVPNADFYTLQAVQASSGPGGGALTVAGFRTTQVAGTVNVPPGAMSMFVAACNGNGCGPYSAPLPMNPSGGNPSVPVLGNPISGSDIDGPDVFFSWNRVAGDNGSNTVYRLYVQDFSRSAPALDVLTTSNFWSAKFRGEGSRYDAVVVANGVTGPPAGFLVRGNSPASPTMAQPRHQTQDVIQAVAAGNVQLGWTAIPGATLYEYLVSVQGQPLAIARGVTPGLLVQVPLPASATFYSGIVRACPAGQLCVFGSDAGWGPWSSSPGQGGVTNFLVR
ncbi:MAG: PQQ-dependent sugar dehydrogenase [Bryobacteraceae bacterium]